MPREEDQHTAEFIHETGLTHEQAASQTDDISVVEVVGFPHKHGKPFVTEEEEINLGTQMFNLHKWYKHKSNDAGTMFGVKYSDHDFFRGEDDFYVDFELLHHIYRRKP